MLIDNKGREVNPDNLPRERKAREAVLAKLTEVFHVRPKHGDFFKLQTRARLV